MDRTFQQQVENEHRRETVVPKEDPGQPGGGFLCLSLGPAGSWVTWAKPLWPSPPVSHLQTVANDDTQHRVWGTRYLTSVTRLEGERALCCP